MDIFCSTRCFVGNNMVLYHATYKAYLDSIMRYGLGAKIPHKNWEDSRPGHVYLTKDVECAIDMAESAELVPAQVYDSGIVVLEVFCDGLPLHRDQNFADADLDETYYGIYFELKGIIPPARLEICNNFMEERK